MLLIKLNVFHNYEMVEFGCLDEMILQHVMLSTYIWSRF